MTRKITMSVLIGLIALASVFYFKISKPIFNFSTSSSKENQPYVNPFLKAKFDDLSKNGNSSCSTQFKDSIVQMSDDRRLRGSCCSPMSMHRYSEQVDGLKKYANIAEIPPDPYDIEAGFTKKMLGYYDLQLTPEEQKSYDYAMQHSNEKGPCCCKCWRWYVYGGLGKFLINKKGFTSEQVTEVWNLSDGCGGEGDHVNHSS